MKMKLLSTTLSSFAVLSLVLVSSSAEAQGRGRDARPKQNGRHDNRNYNPGTSDMRVGHADGKSFRIRYQNGGTGRAPVYNRNAPINRNRWENRYDDRNRYNDRYRDDNRYRYNDNYRDYRNDEYRRREQTKNEWKNIGIASGVIGLLGLLNNDSRVTFAGAAGALYSAYRYEQDRKSQNRVDRARYDLFSQDHFYRDGRRYDRRTVYQGGQKYYQFVCR